MEYLITFLFAMLCLHCLYLMYFKKVKFYLLGVVALFSFGYYILPIYFKEYSHLTYFSTEEISEVSFMALTFFIMIYIGHRVAFSFFEKKIKNGMDFGYFETVFDKHSLALFVIGFVLWVGYALNFDLTSYQAEDSQLYFQTQGKFSGIISQLSGLGLSLIAFFTARAIARKEKKRMLWMSLCFVISLLPLIFTAQRLALITPLFIFMAALGVNGMHRQSIKIAIIGILFLTLISPIMVFLREYRDISGAMNIYEGLLSFSPNSNDYLMTSFESIMGRADGLKVMVELKEYFDVNGSPPFIYYISVFSSFIPRVLWPGKPYPLSDDGTIYGEASVIAWTQFVTQDSIGSLTAFGSIIAYHEGGWLWLPINGFLVGCVFALIYLLLANGRSVGKFFFCYIFPIVCIKKVPPSFFELIVILSSTILIIISLILISRIIYAIKRH